MLVRTARLRVFLAGASSCSCACGAGSSTATASAADASVARSSATGSSGAGVLFFVAFFVAFDAVFLVALMAFFVVFADFFAAFFGAGSFDGASGWALCKESRSWVTSAVDSADCAFLEIPMVPSCSSNTLEDIPNCFASVYTRVFSASCCLSICPANAAAPASCSFNFSSAVAIGHAPVVGRLKPFPRAQAWVFASTCHQARIA